MRISTQPKPQTLSIPKACPETVGVGWLGESSPGELPKCLKLGPEPQKQHPGATWILT